MKRRLVLLAILVSTLLLNLATAFYHPAPAFADQTSDITSPPGGGYAFQDRGHISANMGSFGTVVFTDSDVFDHIYHYLPPSGKFCQPTIKVPIGRAGFSTEPDPSFGITLVNPSFNSSSIKANIELGYKATAGVNSQCNVVKTTTNIANFKQEALSQYTWNGNQINTVDGQLSNVAKSYSNPSGAPSNFYENTNNTSCGINSVIILNSGSTSQGERYVFSSGFPTAGSSKGSPSSIQALQPLTQGNPPFINSNCQLYGQPSATSIGINITGTQGQSSGGSGTGQANQSLSCDVQFTNPLSWLICPIVDALVGIVSAIDNMITAQLNINTGSIFCGTGTCQDYYTAWSSFRDIALGLMAVAGLIVIIAQALGAEILDAYTIRKMLPRILIAAIGITLSWPLMQFFVVFSNNLGIGIRHLIYAPFSGLHDQVSLSFGGDAANVFFGGLGFGALLNSGLGVGMVAFRLIGGLGALLGFAGTAALAVIVAIAVLILRQIVIIMLIILAPIAIVAYILPNTQRTYKLWWESFSRGLMMFPIIAGFIAAGRVFSVIALNAGGGAPDQIIGFIAYFAPYFLIPATFQLAGGALRQIGGFVNDRSRGGFDRLRNFRQARRKAGWEKLQSGRLFGNAPKGSRKANLNRAYQAASLFNPDEISADPRRWRSEARALRERAEWSHANHALESDEFKPILGDDDSSQAALQYGRNGRQAAYDYLASKQTADGSQLYSDQEINQKLAHIDMLRRKFGAGAVNQASIMSAVMASTAYGKDPQTGEFGGIGEVLSDIDWASEGDDNVRAQLISQVKSRAQQAGRTDLVAPFSDMYTQSKIIGSSSDRGAAIKAANDKLTDTIVFTEGAGFVAGGKGAALEALKPALERRIKRAANEVNLAGQEQADIDAAAARGATQWVSSDGKTRTIDEAQVWSIEREDNAHREMKRALASTSALHDIAGQLSDEKAGMIGDIMGAKMPGTNGNATVLQTIDAYRSDDEFNEFRNDFMRRYGSDARTAQMWQQQLTQQPPAPGGAPGGIPPVPGAP